MSRWTHSICEECWKKREPGREPVKIKEPEDEICCFCGSLHGSGIYVRNDPQLTLCTGSHKEEE